MRFGTPVLALIGAVVFSCGGCAGITAINIPGIGWIDSDPPPVTACDRALMKMAYTEAARQMFVGARSTWVNYDTGNSGEYIITKINPYPRQSPCRSYSYQRRMPSAEMTEVISAGGRRYETIGIGVNFNASGLGCL